MAMRIGGLGRGQQSAAPAVEHRGLERPGTSRSFRFRGDSDALLSAALGRPGSLPSLPPVPSDVFGRQGPATPAAPQWSPARVAVPLFAAAWACFIALAVGTTTPPAADVAALGQVLAAGAAVVGLVLVTLSVAHTQVSGLLPRRAAVAVLTAGIGQGVVARTIGSGHDDLWGLGAWVFVLIGVAVPLAWVGGQFQSGVRRQRVELDESLAASWIERARRQATQTVESVHRHDVRSMLFVIDGAARTLADESLPRESRAPFAEMLAEGVQRMSALMDVRSEEIQPFGLDSVARAVAHAERRTGWPVSAELPAQLTAVGRAADVAAVLRTLISVTGRKTDAGIQLLGEVSDGAVVVRVEPAGAEDLPLLTENWEGIWAESFKPARRDDEESIDLYVAARLLADQGADLWTVPGDRARFAVRLPAAGDPTTQEEA